MPPQGPGMVGALPRPAWGAVLGMLSSHEGRPERAWRTTVLSLRRTCKALAELVAAGCAGGAGRLEVSMKGEDVRLEEGPTAGLGRALVVFVLLPDWAMMGEVEAVAQALAVAVERGHMIRLETPKRQHPPDVTRMIEAALIEASREGQLLYANLREGAALGWSVDAMAKLSIVKLSQPERDTIATLVAAGALERIALWNPPWADMSILSSLREVKLFACAIEDLSPLADVPLVVVAMCERFDGLPAMRNDVLDVSGCLTVDDLESLAGGRVGRLELQNLYYLDDVSALGTMQPPPRTVVLKDLLNLEDVSMLAGIHRLELIRCRKLDKAATMAALEGKVGTILWEN